MRENEAQTLLQLWVNAQRTTRRIQAQLTEGGLAKAGSEGQPKAVLKQFWASAREASKKVFSPRMPEALQMRVRSLATGIVGTLRQHLTQLGHSQLQQDFQLFSLAFLRLAAKGLNESLQALRRLYEHLGQRIRLSGEGFDEEDVLQPPAPIVSGQKKSMDVLLTQLQSMYLPVDSQNLCDFYRVRDRQKMISSLSTRNAGVQRTILNYRDRSVKRRDQSTELPTPARQPIEPARKLTAPGPFTGPRKARPQQLGEVKSKVYAINSIRCKAMIRNRYIKSTLSKPAADSVNSSKEQALPAITEVKADEVRARRNCLMVSIQDELESTRLGSFHQVRTRGEFSYTNRSWVRRTQRNSPETKEGWLGVGPAMYCW